MIRVCVAGATGWTGRALVAAIPGTPDLTLVGAVAPRSAGEMLRSGDGVEPVTIRASVSEALDVPTDVLVDFTTPEAALGNVLAAVERGVAAVIGTSGLTEDDYRTIADAAQSARVGVLAVGNFAISAVLLQHFATIAARFFPTWEIIDFAKGGKPDAPSGTARELAHRLSAVRAPDVEISIEDTQGSPAARGATLGGTQVHSVRLPGYVIGADVLFGKEGERLSLRFDAGASAAPYVDGTLLAVRRVRGFVGLRRGLDQVLDLA